MAVKFRYNWNAPLHREGCVHAVKFNEVQRRYTNIRATELCTIESVETRYDMDGTARHLYKVRFNERRDSTVKPKNEKDYQLPQLYVVKESAIGIEQHPVHK